MSAYRNLSADDRRAVRIALKTRQLDRSGDINQVVVNRSNAFVAGYALAWVAVGAVAIVLGPPRAVGLYVLLVVITIPLVQSTVANVRFRRLLRQFSVQQRG